MSTALEFGGIMERLNFAEEQYVKYERQHASVDVELRKERKALDEAEAECWKDAVAERALDEKGEPKTDKGKPVYAHTNKEAREIRRDELLRERYSVLLKEVARLELSKVSIEADRDTWYAKMQNARTMLQYTTEEIRREAARLGAATASTLAETALSYAKEQSGGTIDGSLEMSPAVDAGPVPWSRESGREMAPDF